MSGGIEFENDEWVVTRSSMTHKRVSFWIAAPRLGERRSDGLWAWPMQMLHKPWSDPDQFADAFMAALAAADVPADGALARTFIKIGRRKAKDAAFKHVQHDLGLSDVGMSLEDYERISTELERRAGMVV